MDLGAFNDESYWKCPESDKCIDTVYVCGTFFSAEPDKNCPRMLQHSKMVCEDPVKSFEEPDCTETSLTCKGNVKVPL